MKLFFGIDIGKWKHEAVLMDENGRPIGNAFVFGNSAEGFALLFRYLEVCAPAQTLILMRNCSRGKAPKKALVAAAKLCRIVHAVLSRNQSFDPMLTEKLTIPAPQPEMAT